MTTERVSVDRLQPGLYVCLELPWHAHPFLTNSFRLKHPRQIEAIRKLGVFSVLVDLERSDAEAVAAATAEPEAAAPPPPPPPPASEPEDDALWQEKEARIVKMREFRRRFHACEARFERGADQVKDLMKRVGAQPRAAVEEAEQLISEMTEAFLGERDLVLNLMNVKGQDEGLYYHSLNVTVLSMMLGADIGLGAKELRVLGLGALFHDFGKTRIPDKILHKQGALTQAEQQLYALHPRYGREMLERMEALPKAALAIVERHHEFVDGSGYPQGLAGDKLDPLSRIVALVNAYDDLCNPRDPQVALPPAEALSQMFARLKGRFDPQLLQRFIRMLGVYPPGTIVRLSDGSTGLVISREPDDLLHPVVLLYDPAIPRKEALMLRLKEHEELSVMATIAPAKLDPQAYDWLRPQARVTYFYSPYETEP